MPNFIDKEENLENKALLVAVYNRPDERAHCDEMLEELHELVETAGGEICEIMPVKIRQLNPKYLVGSGKAEEIIARARELDANTIIFDDVLSPGQQRNWEKLSKLLVIDRQEVILEIFSNRASTKEAELQIELAKAEYMLPRLKNAWTHLDRQKGGVGLRGGEGEKQIEIDGRLLRKSISKLKQELKSVRKQRAEQRKRRQKTTIPNAAIVGYTNAGKSMLLNLLTGSKVLVEDKLFATLDPTTRKIVLPNNQSVLVTDTVGFIRKLPHNLVEAFKATLEEAVLSQFLIHVVDINSSNIEEYMQTTEDVLAEIGTGKKESILVFNKVDIAEPYLLRRLRHEYPAAIFMSAKTGEGLEDLHERMVDISGESLKEMTLFIPLDKFDVLALIHRVGHVLSEQYEDDGAYVTASIPGNCQHELEPFLHEC